MTIQNKQTETILKHADSDTEILACFEVMKELRPNLTTPEAFLEQVKRMSTRGYRLLVAWDNGRPIALAGYRDKEMIIHGNFIYVDDLITKESERGRKLGEQLLKFIFNEAREQNYSKVILDTEISNSLAQRFYFRMGMIAAGLHFGYAL